MSEHPTGARPEPLVATPRPASVIVLLRDAPRGRTADATPPGALELFVVSRSRELRMFGDFVALPGGGLCPADGEAAARAGVAPLVACAARELFEETGVLAVPGGVRLDAGVRAELRRALTAREGSDPARFYAVLEQHGLRLADAPFVPAGRWVTPPFVPVRFDAHFFLLRLPGGEGPEVWPGELTSGEWIDPAELVRRWAAGEVLLHPPQSHLARVLEAANREGLRELGDLAPRLASGGHRDAGQVATRVDFQRGVEVFPLYTPTLPPAQHTNCYLLGTGEVLVVDPGSPYEDEQARLRERLLALGSEGMRVRGVLLTHHHVDHVGGAALFARELGVPLLGHPRTLDRVQAPGVRAEPVVDEQVLVLDGPLPMRWRALHTPGHASGHLCLLEEQTRALVAGDMVSTLSTIVIDPPEGDMGAYLDSLARLRALEPRTLYPAHGLCTQHAVAKLEEYLEHRRQRLEALAAALAGRTRALGELVAEVYADVPAIVHPLAARSALASLLLLERQGRARREPGPDGERWAAA